MKLLFIGNSYTYYNDLPALICSLLGETGVQAEAERVLKGGYKLYQYTDPADEKAAELDEKLAGAAYDAAFVQEQSFLPLSDCDAFLGGLTALVGRLRPVCGRIILYQTWGRRPGCPLLEERGWTNESMSEGLAAAYASAAGVLGLEVSPVGTAFSAVMRACPDTELYAPDGSHPSLTGSRLAAAIHVRTLTGVTPSAAQPARAWGMDEDEAARLLEAIRFPHHSEGA